MTIEEKRNAIREHCYKTSCCVCALRDVENCFNYAADIERNYALLFGIEPDQHNLIGSIKMETIKIKYLRDIEKIKPIEVGDWIDLRCAEDVTMKAGEYKAIPLGVAMELPAGYEALVAPRSSTFKKYGVLLANSLGVIDESFKGDGDEWHFLAYAQRDTFIPKNERICQFRIIEHQPSVTLCEVDRLGNVDRSGVGSTGRV